MKTRFSHGVNPKEREWEELSAYLDDQLSPRKRAVVEKRLEESPELRSALEDLSRTRKLIRDQPRKRAPRNFSLSPEMAGLRLGKPALPAGYPALRLASALATIFFVLLSISQFWLTGAPTMKMAQHVSQVLMTSEVEIEAPPAPSFGMGGGAVENTATEVFPAEAPAALALAQPTQEAVNKIAGEASPVTPEADTLEVTPLGLPSTPTLMPAVEMADQAVAVSEEALTENRSLEGEAAPLRTSEGTTSVMWSWSLLKLFQVLLALLAVSTGVAAIWIRKSGRK